MTTHNPNETNVKPTNVNQPDVRSQVLQYRVQIGHEQIVVKGCDRADALREARRRLCLELPRMWDVIEGMDDSRFVVTELT